MQTISTTYPGVCVYTINAPRMTAEADLGVHTGVRLHSITADRVNLDIDVCVSCVCEAISMTAEARPAAHTGVRV